MSDQYKPLRSSAPAHSILSSNFRYTDSAGTNIAATFARVREQQQKAAAKTVVPIRKGAK